LRGEDIFVLGEVRELNDYLQNKKLYRIPKLEKKNQEIVILINVLKYRENAS
jgi:hypothetical protein